MEEMKKLLNMREAKDYNIELLTTEKREVVRNKEGVEIQTKESTETVQVAWFVMLILVFVGVWLVVNLISKAFLLGVNIVKNLVDKLKF